MITMNRVSLYQMLCTFSFFLCFFVFVLFLFFCFTKSVSDDFAQGYTVVTKAPIKVEIDFKNEDFVTDNVSLTSKWRIFYLWLLV